MLGVGGVGGADGQAGDHVAPAVKAAGEGHAVVIVISACGVVADGRPGQAGQVQVGQQVDIGVGQGVSAVDHLRQARQLFGGADIVGALGKERLPSGAVPGVRQAGVGGSEVDLHSAVRGGTDGESVAAADHGGLAAEHSGGRHGVAVARGGLGSDGHVVALHGAHGGIVADSSDGIGTGGVIVRSGGGRDDHFPVPEAHIDEAAAGPGGDRVAVSVGGGKEQPAAALDIAAAAGIEPGIRLGADGGGAVDARGLLEHCGDLVGQVHLGHELFRLVAAEVADVAVVGHMGVDGVPHLLGKGAVQGVRVGEHRGRSSAPVVMDGVKDAGASLLFQILGVEQGLAVDTDIPGGGGEVIEGLAGGNEARLVVVPGHIAQFRHLTGIDPLLCGGGHGLVEGSAHHLQLLAAVAQQAGGHTDQMLVLVGQGHQAGGLIPAGTAVEGVDVDHSRIVVVVLAAAAQLISGEQLDGAEKAAQACGVHGIDQNVQLVPILDIPGSAESLRISGIDDVVKGLAHGGSGGGITVPKAPDPAAGARVETGEGAVLVFVGLLRLGKEGASISHAVILGAEGDVRFFQRYAGKVDALQLAVELVEIQGDIFLPRLLSGTLEGGVGSHLPQHGTGVERIGTASGGIVDHHGVYAHESLLDRQCGNCRDQGRAEAKDGQKGRYAVQELLFHGAPPHPGLKA